MNKRHFLKTVQPYYTDVAQGRKKFEIRINDRDYRVGDNLVLIEWKQYYGEDAKKPEFTGKMIEVTVTHIFSDALYGVNTGFIVMSIDLLSTELKTLHSMYQQQIDMKKLNDCGIKPEYLIGS